MGYEERKLVWWKFHKDNPHVYDLFARYTHEAIDSGVKKCSPWLIVNRIRWETAITTTDTDFKRSNDYIAFYSRLFLRWNPRQAGFFKTKQMKGETYAISK